MDVMKLSSSSYQLLEKIKILVVILSFENHSNKFNRNAKKEMQYSKKGGERSGFLSRFEERQVFPISK